ncbi:MAG TPA: FKBP-type peptidyl-prolyl cis-trans isomerase [Acidiferrobacteraceae bacterium]|nr:FKBP-type peptidyl-prolyl cis-trans isomerase [Acidiferrobacteraceae bacterium]
MPGIIDPHSEVVLHFCLMLADGTVVDDTRSEEPFTFRMGEDTLAPGIEARLLGLAEGEERRLEIPAVEAYGLEIEDSVRAVARSEFPANWSLEAGTAVSFALPDGSEVPATVLQADADSVLVDFSHPLAGRDLIMDVRILYINREGSGQDGHLSG